MRAYTEAERWLLNMPANYRSEDPREIDRCYQAVTSLAERGSFRLRYHDPSTCGCSGELNELGWIAKRLVKSGLVPEF